MSGSVRDFHEITADKIAAADRRGVALAEAAWRDMPDFRGPYSTPLQEYLAKRIGPVRSKRVVKAIAAAIVRRWDELQEGAE